jgi:hypothetical protein
MEPVRPEPVGQPHPSQAVRIIGREWRIEVSHGKQKVGYSRRIDPSGNQSFSAGKPLLSVGSPHKQQQGGNTSGETDSQVSAANRKTIFGFISEILQNYFVSARTFC